MKTQHDYYKILGISPAEAIKLNPMSHPNVHRSGPFKIDDTLFMAKSKAQEVQKLIQQNQQLKRNSKKAKSLQQENKQYRIKFNDVKNQHQNLLTQKRDLELELRSALKKAALVEERQRKFKSQVSFLKDSNAQLQRNLAELNFEFEESKEKSKRQLSVIKSSNLELKKYASQFQQLKSANEKFKQQNKRLKQSMQELERSSAQNARQLQASSQQLSRTTRSLQSCKIQYQSKINQLSLRLRSVTQTQSQTLTALRRENEQLQRQLGQFQSKLRQLDLKSVSLQKCSEEKDRIIQGLRGKEPNQEHLKSCIQNLNRTTEKLKIINFQKFILRSVAKRMSAFIQITKQQHAEQIRRDSQQIDELKFKNEELREQLQRTLLELRAAQQNLATQKSRKSALMRLNAQLSEQNQAIKRREHRIIRFQMQTVCGLSVETKFQKMAERDYARKEKITQKQRRKQFASVWSQTDFIKAQAEESRLQEQVKPLAKDQKSQLRKLRKEKSELTEQLRQQQSKLKYQFQNEKEIMKKEFENVADQLRSQNQRLNKSLQLLRIDKSDP